MYIQKGKTEKGKIDMNITLWTIYITKINVCNRQALAPTRYSTSQLF